MSDFINMLQNLMSPDNALRSQAESYFNAQVESNSIEITQNLVQILSNKESDLILRSFAGILLRRSLDRVSSVVGPDVVSQLRAALMQIFMTEESKVILKRISHAMAQSASDGTWPDLLPSLIAQSQQNQQQSDALIAILNLIEIVSEYSSDDIVKNLTVIGGFLASLLTASDINVQIACAKASGACIVTLEDDSARESFKPALNPIINVLGATLTAGEETEATTIMEHLVTIAQIQPLFFKGTVENVVAAMVQVAGSEGLEFPTRSMALELLVTLTESAPALARRCPALIQNLVPIAMSIMTDLDDTDTEWSAEKYTVESNDDNYFVGEEAIERAAAGLGGKSSAQPIMEAVNTYYARAEPESRRAAVAAMHRLAEGAPKFFKIHLPSAVEMLRLAVNDVSPRVQYEAIQMVGRLGSLYPGKIEDIINTFMQVLSHRLADPAVCDKVRGHAASALINIINPESCQTDVLEPHLPDLLNSLCVCLQGAPLEVQSPCLTLLGCAAQVSVEEFKPFYSSFMPGVKQILHNACGEQFMELRGKAMQCVGLIGEAVGDEVFAGDALEIMQLLIRAIGHQEANSDVLFDSILPACARISKALGAKFEPFLPFVMTPVFTGAAQVIQFSMVDADDDQEDGEAEHDEDAGTDSAVINLGNGVRKKVTLNTHAVQQKAQAARLLYEFSANMKGNLKTYLSPMLDHLLPLVTDKNSGEIRSSALLGLASLFEAVVDAAKKGFVGVDVVASTFSSSMAKLLESLKGEVRAEVRACAGEAIRDVLIACYESGEENADGSRGAVMVGPDLSQAAYLSAELMERCGESVARRNEKVNSIASNDALDTEDEEQFAELLEEEEGLLSDMVDAIGQLLKILGEEFMAIFDSTVATKFAPYLSNDQPNALQIIAVCMLDDAIEFGGATAHKYIPQVMNAFVNNLSSEDSVLRQSSAYGLAQIVRVAPQYIIPQFQTVVQSLISLATSPDAQEDENEGTTENALFAIGCILSDQNFRAGAVDWVNVSPSNLCQIWLQGLPLKADDKEAKITSAMLCNAIENQDALVLGENCANAPDIIRIFAEVLHSVNNISGKSNYAHSATISRMQILLKGLCSNVNGAAAAASSKLTQAQQQVLSNAVNA